MLLCKWSLKKTNNLTAWGYEGTGKLFPWEIVTEKLGEFLSHPEPQFLIWKLGNDYDAHPLVELIWGFQYMMDFECWAHNMDSLKIGDFYWYEHGKNLFIEIISAFNIIYFLNFVLPLNILMSTVQPGISPAQHVLKMQGINKSQFLFAMCQVHW